MPVLVEIEVGENRSGVIEEADFLALLDTIRICPHVPFGGIFSHDGNSYSASDLDALRALSEGAQRRTLHFVQLAAQHGMPCQTVSYGATPTFMNHVDILPRHYLELRPGTYALMDASQGHAIGTAGSLRGHRARHGHQPPDGGAHDPRRRREGLTMQSRTEGDLRHAGQGHALRPAGDAHCKGL